MPPLVVTTVNGNRYRLADELGRGGQGAVFGVDGGRYAVKLLRDRSERAREALRDRLAMVKRLPLEDLPLAPPGTIAAASPRVCDGSLYRDGPAANDVATAEG